MNLNQKKYAKNIIVVLLAIYALDAYSNPVRDKNDPQDPKLSALADELFQIFSNAGDLSYKKEAAGKKPGEVTIMRRPVFAKAHGCLMGQFQVAKSIPNNLRIGVFAQRSPYTAWVRFSNDSALGPDSPSDDQGNPARGMAIKLLDVKGQPLLPYKSSYGTQDFIMQNNPGFFAANAQDFLSFILDRDFLKNHPKEASILKEIETTQLSDPLTSSYWTPTPYRLGSKQAMKYKVTPCSSKVPFTQMEGDNYLRDNLEKHVQAAKNSKDLCFNFYIQLYKNEKDTPLEDASQVWSESISPPILAAQLLLMPQQDFLSPKNIEFCEDLSFNPWHGVKDHEPLGSINTVRGIVYHKSMLKRRQFNSHRIVPKKSNQK